MVHAAVVLLLGPLLSGSSPGVIGVEEVIFAARQPGVGSHWYENFGHYAQDEQQKAYRALGRLCRLDLRSGRLTVLLDDADGSIRDPQVHYDGAKILFSYRPGGSDYFHLYEIGADGRDLRQLTSGPYDDIEPTYLPGGGIMFCSSRCKRWVNCWFTQVAVLYACDADGRNIHPLSANIEHDNAPWPLPDGRVIYTRWEYVDRSRVSFPPVDGQPGRHQSDGVLRKLAPRDRHDRRQTHPRQRPDRGGLFTGAWPQGTRGRRHDRQPQSRAG